MKNINYRQSVYALLIKNDKILMVQKKSNSLWDFPGGGIDPGETIEQAITREISEELGTQNIKIIHNGKTTNKYDWPEKEVQKHFDKTGILRKGQEQNFVIVQFNGQDSDIKLQEDELLSYKWVPVSELKLNMSYQDQYDTVIKVLHEYNFRK